MRDMQKRKEIILGANANLVVSVHQNFCPLPSRRGAQVFYNGERESGKALADCIQGSLNFHKNKRRVDRLFLCYTGNLHTSIHCM